MVHSSDIARPNIFQIFKYFQRYQVKSGLDGVVIKYFGKTLRVLIKNYLNP